MPGRFLPCPRFATMWPGSGDGRRCFWFCCCSALGVLTTEASSDCLAAYLAPKARAVEVSADWPGAVLSIFALLMACGGTGLPCCDKETGPTGKGSLNGGSLCSLRSLSSLCCPLPPSSLCCPLPSSSLCCPLLPRQSGGRTAAVCFACGFIGVTCAGCTCRGGGSLG